MRRFGGERLEKLLFHGQAPSEMIDAQRHVIDLLLLFLDKGSEG
jgi:hypothetical protein